MLELQLSENELLKTVSSLYAVIIDSFSDFFKCVLCILGKYFLLLPALNDIVEGSL